MKEPVAWMDSEGFVYRYQETRPVKANIPLYTAPRELSNDEIESIWFECGDDEYTVIRFAKAILKKASEK